MGKNITLVGGNGDGQTTKVANQIIVALNIEAVAEALVFASKAGADPAKVRQALMGGFAASRILEVHGERMIKRTFDPGFRIELHQKDLNLALAGARALGVSLPNTATARSCSTPAPPTAARAGTIRRMVKALELMANHRRRRGLSPGHGAAGSSCARCSTPPWRRPTRPWSCRRTCQPPPKGRTIVVGAGKASAAMGRRWSGTGRASCRAWSSPATATARPCQRIEVVEAAHPVPDEAGQGGGRAHPGAGRSGLSEPTIWCWR